MNKEYKQNSIKNWAEEDRPREKLSLKGKNTLSDAELLAILIGSGSRNETAVELSKRILQEYNNNWNDLAKLSISDLCNFKGIGEAKAISIITALEIGKRRSSQSVFELPRISSAEEAFPYLFSFLGDLPHEEFWVVFLNRANKIIGKEQMSKGGIAGTVVDIRLILKKSIENSASAIIVAHNHPSGNLKPSEADISLTKKLLQSCKILDIELFDHLIIGNNDFFSFKEAGIF